MIHSYRQPQPLFFSSMLMALAAPTATAAEAAAEESVADMTLEDMLNIKVTTASRKSQSLSDVPAAVFVITGEDTWPTVSMTIWPSLFPMNTWPAFSRARSATESQ